MTKSITIAFPTNDGQTIAPAMGQARLYLLVTIEDGVETARAVVDKPHHRGHHHHNHNDHDDHHHGPPKGVFKPLQPAQVIILGGIGEPGARAINAMGLEMISTSIRSVEQALAAYLTDSLHHEAHLVHAH